MCTFFTQQLFEQRHCGSSESSLAVLGENIEIQISVLCGGGQSKTHNSFFADNGIDIFIILLHTAHKFSIRIRIQQRKACGGIVHSVYLDFPFHANIPFTYQYSRKRNLDNRVVQIINELGYGICGKSEQYQRFLEISKQYIVP